MRRDIRILALLLPATIALAPADSLGQPKDVRMQIAYSAGFIRCMDRAGGSTRPMLDCMQAETARWDQRLNAAYRGMTTSRDVADDTKALLRDAQRAWITYRDKACAAAGDLEAKGGSLALIVAGDCVLRMTAQRAAELEGRLAVE